MSRLVVNAVAGGPLINFPNPPIQKGETYISFELIVAVSHSDTGAPMTGLGQRNFQCFPHNLNFPLIVGYFHEYHPGLYSFSMFVNGVSIDPITIQMFIRVKGPLPSLPLEGKVTLPDEGQAVLAITITGTILAAK
jgi:hypothetical protein